jgi:hypothetical protein
MDKQKVQQVLGWIRSIGISVKEVEEVKATIGQSVG